MMGDKARRKVCLLQGGLVHASLPLKEPVFKMTDRFLRLSQVSQEDPQRKVVAELWKKFLGPNLFFDLVQAASNAPGKSVSKAFEVEKKKQVLRALKTIVDFEESLKGGE